MGSPMHGDENSAWPLRDLGGRLPICEWREVTWSECIGCGLPGLYGPCDEDERLLDGEPLVCSECGMLHHMWADSEGWAIMDDRDMDDRWVFLRPTALAGLRRLLGLQPAWQDWEVARG